MRNRRSRSQFTSLSDGARSDLREAAVTMAQQGLRRPMVEAKDARHGGSTPMVTPTDAEKRGVFGGGGAPNEQPVERRPQEAHPPGNVGGTYNSSSPGRTAGSTDANTGGAEEVMARVIFNQQRSAGGPSPQATAGPSAPAWPGTHGQTGGPIMPRRRRR